MWTKALRMLYDLNLHTNNGIDGANIHLNAWDITSTVNLVLRLKVTIGNGSVREGPNRTGSEPNRLKILKLEPNRTEPRNR